MSDQAARVRVQKAKAARTRELIDGVHRANCKPTGAPMPAWMTDPTLLPRRPPGQQP